MRNERGGELVIRALDQEEMNWLANFNATYEHGAGNDFMELSEEEKSDFYLQDNARRRDLYFVAKSSGNLIQYDLMEIDRISFESEKDIAPEDLKLNHLEGKREKVKRKRTKRNTQDET